MIEHPPFVVSNEARLGDPIVVLEQPYPDGGEEVPLSVEALESWVRVLEDRIARLEQQTPLAYWRRHVAWWKWLWHRVIRRG